MNWILANDEVPLSIPTPRHMRAYEIVIAAYEVARQRGDECGLCDAMDNGGQPYPSASGGALLQTLKDQGRKPMLFLKDLEG